MASLYGVYASSVLRMALTNGFIRGVQNTLNILLLSCNPPEIQSNPPFPGQLVNPLTRQLVFPLSSITSINFSTSLSTRQSRKAGQALLTHLPFSNPFLHSYAGKGSITNYYNFIPA
jgi:hypothetical protein